MSILLVLIVTMLSACTSNGPQTHTCTIELDKFNLQSTESIIITRDVLGESGYSAVVPGCEFLVPFSISEIEREERIAINEETRQLIVDNPQWNGVGFFQASCDCRFDPESGILIARSLDSVRPQDKPTFDR